MVLLFGSGSRLSIFVVLFWALSFFIPLKKSPKNRTQQNDKKAKNAEKNGQVFFQLTQLCLQIVFLIFGRA